MKDLSHILFQRERDETEIGKFAKANIELMGRDIPVIPIILHQNVEAQPDKFTPRRAETNLLVTNQSFLKPKTIIKIYRVRKSFGPIVDSSAAGLVLRCPDLSQTKRRNK